MTTVTHDAPLALSREARSELLNTLEAALNLLYLVERGGVESNRHLADMKRELNRATTLLMTMQEC